MPDLAPNPAEVFVSIKSAIERFSKLTDSEKTVVAAALNREHRSNFSTLVTAMDQFYNDCRNAENPPVAFKAGIR